MTAVVKERRVIILGALSAIGEATAREFAAEGASIVIAGRCAERLGQVADDLTARGASHVTTWPVDFSTVEDPNVDFDRMVQQLGGSVDVVMLFYGLLGDQERAERDIAELRSIISVNFSSAAEWCVATAGLLERQNHGILVAISSVAGDRGRKSNYIYGSAKAGLTVLIEGIAHRLARGEARAVAVKLGFVDTPMTAQIQKGGVLWVKPDYVARRLLALVGRSSKPIVYIPTFWRPIMGVIRMMPASIFHRTSF